jgi:hypothetical protein
MINYYNCTNYGNAPEDKDDPGIWQILNLFFNLLKYIKNKKLLKIN